MTTSTTPQTPYVPSQPGDLITAENFNRMQTMIKDDIDARVRQAIADLKSVAESGNSAKLGGQTSDELLKAFLERALQQIPARTGYQRVYKRIKLGDERLIEHKLKAKPLVDAYLMQYFPVVRSEDETKVVTWVNFYLYHTSEMKQRNPEGGQPVVIEDVDDEHAFKEPFADLLSYYKVSYDDNSSLDDLVTEFWKALFAAPNDQYDESQFGHSPWFDKCCGERRTVAELKRRGDWNDLWLKSMPTKTINWPRAPLGATFQQGNGPRPVAAPPNIEVKQYDLDTVGIRALPLQDGTILYPAVQDGDYAFTGFNADGAQPIDDSVDQTELKLMVLLKV